MYSCFLTHGVAAWKVGDRRCCSSASCGSCWALRSSLCMFGECLKLYLYIYISVYLWYLWYFWYLWDLNRWWNSETLPTFLIFLMFFHSFLHFFATSRLGRTTAIPQPRPWSHGSGQLAPAAGSQGKIARPVALSRSLFSMYIYIYLYIDSYIYIDIHVTFIYGYRDLSLSLYIYYTCLYIYILDIYIYIL